jgi:Endoribonuclease L-PSP
VEFQLAAFRAAAQRFFCAMEIRCRAAFDSFLRLRVLPAGRPPVFRAAIPASIRSTSWASFSMVCAAILLKAGTHKSKLLTAHVWLANMKDFEDHNSLWNEWVDRQNPPVRTRLRPHEVPLLRGGHHDFNQYVRSPE